MPEPETEESYARRLGAVITELRLARGLDTQQKLADHIGRHVSTIQRCRVSRPSGRRPAA